MGQLQQGGGQKADPCLYSEAGTSSCLGDWFCCPSLPLLPDLSCPGLSKVTILREVSAGNGLTTSAGGWLAAGILTSDACWQCPRSLPCRVETAESQKRSTQQSQELPAAAKAGSRG